MFEKGNIFTDSNKFPGLTVSVEAEAGIQHLPASLDSRLCRNDGKDIRPPFGKEGRGGFYASTLWLCLFILLAWASSAAGHGIEVPVIVDTDGALDDIRAVAMLLNTSGSVRLIVTSDGVLSPESAKTNMNRVLKALDRSDIPVATGRGLTADPPPFRAFNQSLIPASSSPPETGPPAEKVIRETLSETDEVIYLCLGPMTNLADALNADPGAAKKINRVIYLGDAPDSAHPGWNTLRDEASARAVFASGVPVYAIALPDDEYLGFDQRTYEGICRISTPAARLLCQIHAADAVQARIAENHLRIWDEMAVMYMNRPEYFSYDVFSGGGGYRRVGHADLAAIRAAYLKLLENPADFHLHARESVVLREFPADPGLFRDDVAPRAAEIINAHGLEEWKACLLTNELHRHLGIYSLVGAKMGIYARELLEAPFDTLTVVSHAGSAPPLSCLNDGLQVSTGASLGRGTISVNPDGHQPAAEFIYRGMVLTLTLKPEYVKQIRADISAALDRFGTTSPAYFAHVRSLSIDYWRKFDRTRMFDAAWQRQ